MTPTRFGSANPSAETHLAGAESNLEFAKGLVLARPDDAVAVGWAITALFYAALHETRAYLVAVHGKRIVAHEDMRPLWDAHPEMRPVKAPYMELKQQSESARYYLSREFRADDFVYLKNRYELIRPILRPKTHRALRA